MLIKCPECELQISDKAVSCPHCGFPLKQDLLPKKKRYNTNKRKRLPNGFGQITKLKDYNLRKPYRAMVTVGVRYDGKPIVKILKPEGYFATYNDAYFALMEYHKNPYDLDNDITVYELYQKWTEEYFKTLKQKASERTIICAWSYCSSVYNMRAKDLRPRHIKGCMDDGTAIVKGVEKHASPGIKARIKSMFNLMYDFAVEYEIVDKNYPRTFNISNDIIKESENAKRGHIPFTDEEINILWENVDKVKYVDVILIQCYSGWRPQELGLINVNNVDIENWTFTGGIKTDAGINRLVPIHEKIRGIVKKKYDEAIELGSEFLINCTDTKNGLAFTYDKYLNRFTKIVNVLGLNKDHRPHDPRKHFVTMAKKYNVDEYAIKYIVGHNIQDITERVYTQREVDWLIKEMSKIR